MQSLSPRVLVTRAQQQASDLAGELRARGAEPVLVPVIETVQPASFEALDEALAHLHSFHWLLFTSANAVEAFGARLALAPGDEGLASGARSWKVAAIGPATARALQKLGLAADLVPPQAVAESLTEALLPQAHQLDGSPTRFLLVRAEQARELLPETLRNAGAEVTVAPAYRTVVPERSVELLQTLFAADLIDAGSAAAPRKPGAGIDAVAFTSSSTARNLFALCEAAGVDLPADVLRVSIGPITSETLRELGFPPHAEAPEATVASLAETVLRAWRSHPRGTAPAAQEPG